jgi:hypothetical protein
LHLVALGLCGVEQGSWRIEFTMSNLGYWPADEAQTFRRRP